MLVTRYFPTLGETGQGQQPGALRRGCQAGRKSPLLLTSWCCARQTPSSRPGCRSGAPPTSPQESFSQNLWLLYLRLKRGLTPGTKHNRKADRAGEREDLVLGLHQRMKGLPSPSVGRGWQPAITAITAGAGAEACSLHILFESSPLQKGQGCIYRNVWGSLLSHLHFSLSLLSSPQFPTKMKSCSR